MIKRRYTILFSYLLHASNILERCPRSSCLTLDNRISVVANDCYARASIGFKLSDAIVVSRDEVESLTECKEQCSKNGSTCNAFTFGVYRKFTNCLQALYANSARELFTSEYPPLREQKLVQMEANFCLYVSVSLDGNRTCGIASRIPTLQDLETHPDYDVYLKKKLRGSAWCNIDRPFQLFTLGNKSRTIPIENPKKEGFLSNAGDLFSKQRSTPSRPILFPRDRNVTLRYGLIDTYDLFVNHDGRFLSGDDDRNRVLDILTNRNQGPASSSSFVTICHRNLQPGKKMMDLHVERIVPCENVQDCRWACDYEKTFICNGYNYRRETNGSKDTCELVSTPYYRTNVNRDFLTDSRYDYYERDRNCYSPPMNGGDGASWTDRAKTDQPNRPDSFALFDREDRDFVSRGFSAGHVRTNKRFPFETSRDFAPRHYPTEAWSNDPRKDSNIVDNVDSRRGPRINYDDELYSLSSKTQLENRSHKFFNPEENEHFYGKFYNYGSAFGYNDDNRAPTAKEFPYAEREKSSETSKCSILLTSGSKLSRNVLRKTCLVRDMKECEDSCINESSFPCESFAYRYNVLTTNPTDNCLLSELSYQHFNFYTDLEPDRDYDIYVTSQDSNICRTKEETTKRYPSEECFSRVRSGFGIPTDVTKTSMQASDLGGCQYACATSRQFLCRSFAFKYATERRDDRDRATPNCFLTDWSSEEMNPVNMLDMDGAELYERNSSPYGCEAYPLTVPHKQLDSPNADETCYAQHHGSCKLLPHAVVSSTQAITKSECCRKCSNMRNVGWTPCMSFNYMIAADNTRDNCWLSNIPARDLRPHLDYVYDEEHALYTWKDLDPYCSLTVNPLGSNEHGQPSFSPAFVQPHDERVPSDQPIFDSYHTARNRFRPGDHEQQDYERNRETDNVDAGPDYPQREIGYQYPKDRSIFRRYTVNGYPCRNGSVCQRNEIAGFWSCETEGSERGSWDYCCEPNHRCGFSQGYRYPWCYVGPSEEQWRPCSETYYPHYATKNHRPFHSPPPNSLARHWPVIYLHETLPPNCTDDNHFDKEYFNEYHRRDSS